MSLEAHIASPATRDLYDAKRFDCRASCAREPKTEYGRGDKTSVSAEPQRLGERAIAAMRLRRLSPRTQESYLRWMRRFWQFNGRRDPESLGPEHVTTF